MDLSDGAFSKDDLWIHDEGDLYKAQILARFFDDPTDAGEDYLPRPFGVLYEADRPCYEDLLFAQLNAAKEQKGTGDLDALLSGGTTWEIE